MHFELDCQENLRKIFMSQGPSRKEYQKAELLRSDLNKNPFLQFAKWYEEVEGTKAHESDAMQLATATKEGKPSCRTVLLKQFSNKGFIFYTNYESRKAKEIAQNPQGFATFLWKNLERQVCLEGSIEKIDPDDTARYFISRPRGAQIGAWASRQDSTIESREHLDAEYNRILEFYEGKPIPVPPFWGGYRLIPTRFEFWQGRLNRLHDRFHYILQDGIWIIERLSP